ncbi:hypothetical protein ACE01N_05485 [Saccharicrinis sp. FJH2]
MGNKRCKLSDKDYSKKIPEKPKYECKKCGRQAKKEDKVCKPMKVKAA